MLYCIAPYKSVINHQPMVCEPGDVITDPELIDILMRDAPGCFSVKEPTQRQVENAKNRMVTESENRGEVMNTQNFGATKPRGRRS